MITNSPDWGYPTNGAQCPDGDGECVADIWPVCWCEDCSGAPLNLKRENR